MGEAGTTENDVLDTGANFTLHSMECGPSSLFGIEETLTRIPRSVRVAQTFGWVTVGCKGGEQHHRKLA
jgi:hypothetical protein